MSSYNTSAGLTVTLPSTTNLPSGWSIGLATDQGKPLTAQINATAGGHILYPLANAAAQTTLSLAGNLYEYVTLQYDGTGNFRVEQVTPATAQQLGLAGIGGITRWAFPSVSAYSVSITDNGSAISAFNSPLAFLTVTLPSVNAINPGWTLAIANDNGKTAALQVNPTNGGHILFPGGGASVTSLQLAAGNYELALVQFDGSNFRVLQVTPVSAAAIGLSGATCLPRWNFPSVSSYSAGPADCGLTLSNYNTPIASLTVTLPPTTAIAAGWSMSFVTDNGKSLTVQVNGISGGQILLPGTRGAQSALTLYHQNYELVTLQFDGSNFRIASISPASATANGLFPPTGTPSSSSAACQTGQLQFDSNYLYACTSPNTWKRTALSTF